MWAIAARIAGEEPHDGVVGSFLNHVICKFTWAEPERVETIIETVRARMPIGGTTANSRRDHVATALGGLAAQLWVWQGRSRALEWLTEWAQNPGATGDILRSFISLFRGAFFSRYATAADDDDRAISDRAQQAATIILENAGEAVEASFVVISRQDAGEEERESAISTYRSAQQVIHHLMNQLYFGSGAYREGREATIGLMQPEAMHRFLDDYEPVLTLLAESREPATHHHLVELYEHLVPGDPERVFDALHALLTGPGAREGYHFEALAVGVIVRVITRYIADYRSIFEDDTRRARLIEILRLFSDVGWPDALRLLYEIPELLR
jgi:hypothetical protein